MNKVLLSVLGVSFLSSSALAFTDDVKQHVSNLEENTVIFSDVEKHFKFNGYKKIRRGEFLHWLLKNKNIDIDKYKTDYISDIFIDVVNNNKKNTKKTLEISAGYTLGVLNQFEKDGKFLQNKKLTRIEAMRMLVALENISLVQDYGSEMSLFWGDLPKSEKDKNLMLVAIQKGFLQNKAGLTSKISEIKPYDYLTKDDAAWMLYILNNQYKSENTINTISGNSDEESLKNLQKVRTLLDSQYLRQNDLDETDLEDAAIQGMVESLNDPYSVYLPPEESEAFTSYINQEPKTEKEYAGLGVAIQSATNGGLVITEIFDGSPAQISKMQVGDVIVGVDGVSMKDSSVSDIVEKIKGEVGTSSILMIERNSKVLNINFIRKKIFVENLSTVNYEIKDHILWIKVRSFKSFTSRDFKKILDENIIENSGIKGVIVDLRFNPGGLMNVAQEMLGEVLAKDSIAVRLYNSAGSEDIYYVDGSANYTEIPLVVFQNEYSASASEIFSAAIKDYERGDIIGTTSFGKGIAQQLFTLPRGSLKVTTSEFRSPFQNIIHKIGVKPDHEMKNQSDESYFYEAKLRLR